MGWSISNISNTVHLNKKQALELSKDREFLLAVAGETDVEYDSDEDRLYDLFESNKKNKYDLIFSEDHMEHMDYVSSISDKLKELKVKGDITFGSLEGDNEGSYWGYRFDGTGGMKTLTGVVTFVED